MTNKKDDDDLPKPPSKWGKGKTDPDTWFKKGGPPGPGRGKGTKNQKTLFEEAIGVKVKGTLAGKQVSISKHAMGFHQLANKSASGDLNAMKIVLELGEKYEPVEAAPPTEQETQADIKILQQYCDMLMKFASSKSKQGDND